jgi:hypothetical protein
MTQYEQIINQETGNMEYGIIDTIHKIAIIRDCYVTWIYRLKITGKRNNKHYLATKIIGLFPFQIDDLQEGWCKEQIQINDTGNCDLIHNL